MGVAIALGIILSIPFVFLLIMGLALLALIVSILRNL